MSAVLRPSARELSHPSGHQFDLAAPAAYRHWRDQRLSEAPRSEAELIVDVRDPRALSASERSALADRCRRANMAIYRQIDSSGETAASGRQITRAVGLQFGLQRLDANWLADEDGISPIAVSEGPSGGRGSFIPYTNRAIKWHTDGYYQPAARSIRAMVLHCVSPAAAGGTNALLDHELAYIAIRDINPEFIAALSADDVMTIPARTDEDGVARPAQSGPVFSVGPDGALQMRYTARTRSIVWKDDLPTRSALACLERCLAESPHVRRVRLAPGMGVITNNVLHDRDAFIDDPERPRLLYRARYLDRIQLDPSTGLTS